MQNMLYQLISLAMRKQATDIHFHYHNNRLKIMMRGKQGMENIHSAAFSVKLFHYLKYIADLDLGNSDKPQSGSFSFVWNQMTLSFRFSLISSYDTETGVLRILNNHHRIVLKELSHDEKQTAIFEGWVKQTSGMVILSGPTGSGKTTTLYALLSEIAAIGRHKIMTLEDPIEIQDERFVQLQVNEAAGFTYEEGIRQFMRHDPDVIMIGEIRDAYSARMAYRCALSGHMVFSCVHAKNAAEAIKRLNELGISNHDLSDTLTAVCSQRLYPHQQKEKERICIYEILQGAQLQKALANQAIDRHEDIYAKIKQAIRAGLISTEAASGDLYLEAL